MLFDENLLFSDAQAITANTASTKSYKTYGDIGKGIPIPLCIQVVEDFDNLTYLTVKFQTATDEDFTSPVILQEATLPLADLKAGKVFPINYIPTGCLDYVRLFYYITSAENAPAPTKGKITAGVVTALEQN